MRDVGDFIPKPLTEGHGPSDSLFRFAAALSFFPRSGNSRSMESFLKHARSEEGVWGDIPRQVWAAAQRFPINTGSCG